MRELLAIGISLRNKPGPAIVLLIAMGLITGCTQPDEPENIQATASADMEVPVARLGDTVVPLRYDLELSIDPTQENFSGRVEIDIAISSPVEHIWLHGDGFDISDIGLLHADGTEIGASYEQKHDSGVALVSLEQPVAGGEAKLSIAFERSFAKDTGGLFKVVRGEDAYAATQFEAISARKAFPGFDEPVFKVPFELSLVTRADHVAITTTPELLVETLENDYVRRVFDTTEPLPTYLIAFAVGPYDLVDYGTIPANSIRAREVPLRAIAARGLGERLNYALDNTPGMLSVLEEYFGTPYPYRKLDLIAVPNFFGGAMENVGAITYNEYILLMDENSPVEQRRIYTFVHAHEMGHMWFGNLVTPEWWNDIWLNEAFASWIMYKTADTYWPEGEFDRETLKGALGAMTNDSLAAARQIREPVAHNDSIRDAFDSITYSKGAGVLAMLERYVGDENFRDGVRLHMDRHADGTATAEDFIASVAEGSDRQEIETAFKTYIEQPGVPLLSTRIDCSTDGAPELVVSQGRYAPLGSAIEPTSGQWHVPMCFAFSAGGENKTQCTLLDEREQTIALDTELCPDRVHPNADGTGYYRFALDDASWQKLIQETHELPATEALVLADSLDAAFRAGKVSAQIYVEGMAALVNHSAWDVADAATAHLESMINILDAEQLATVESAYRNIVGSRFAALGESNDAGTEILRERMQRFLIIIAKDQAMREPLAELAAESIGLDGEANPSAAPGGQLETILSVGVQDIGEPFFDLLLEQAYASQDPQFRVAAIGALARVEDPALAGKLQTALLEERFSDAEAGRILFRQLARTKTAELTYQWIIDNWDAVLESVPESNRGGTVPAFGGSFCSVERANEWEDIILSNADRLAGYERPLAQATESVRLCAALREARAGELVAELEKIG